MEHHKEEEEEDGGSRKRGKEKGKDEWGIIALERREGQKEGND